MNPIKRLTAYVLQRIQDHAREVRIETLEHNKKFAEQNGMYYFHKMLIEDIRLEKLKRSPGQVARLAKNNEKKVKHD